MYEQIASNRRKTVLLLMIFFVIIIGFGYYLSVYYQSPDILWGAALLSIGMSWWSYFAGDKTILGLGGAKLVSESNSLEEKKIQHLVENLCITTGMPMPKVYIMDDPAPNAFAVGRGPKHASIALTSGLISKLDKAEIEGVIAHELSHVRNYDILLATIVVTLLGVIVMSSDWLLRSRFRHNNNRQGGNAGGGLMLIGLVLAILSPILARLIYFAISRKREYLADASGALMTRYPEGLASALKKISTDDNKLKSASRATAGLYIVNPFHSKNLAELFSTHPPIEKRIAALDNMNV
ncbi:M48 family metallopeptidase [Patescibacteria group bacterium]|nr:M48 family metallopeptidase [Patescibacteria group bacterium]